MPSTRSLALAIMLGGLPAVLPVAPIVAAARAAEPQPFTPAAFAAAQKAGLPILVEVTAPWCPTCKAQKPLLSRLAADPRFARLAVFTVDFDGQKDVLRALGVRVQSTLISYKGATEVARSTGVTDRAAIEAQLAKSI